MKKIKSLCVYCGSSEKGPVKHLLDAKELGYAISQRKIKLIYGGGRVGVMGAVANAAIENNGTVTGVIPEFLMHHEVGHEGITKLEVVSSMHERKARMAELSDGFIVLPGGLGTLEELFEILTWAQLGLHKNPVGVLNVNGFYDKLLDYLDHAVAEKFIRLQHREMLVVDEDIESMFERFSKYEPPIGQKWVDLETNNNEGN